MNKVILEGTLDSDPISYRHSVNGYMVSYFSLVTREYWTDYAGNDVYMDVSHVIKSFRDIAEFTYNSLRKNMTIRLEGKIEYHNRNDDEDRHYLLVEILAEEIKLLQSNEVVASPIELKNARDTRALRAYHHEAVTL